MCPPLYPGALRPLLWVFHLSRSAINLSDQDELTASVKRKPQRNGHSQTSHPPHTRTGAPARRSRTVARGVNIIQILSVLRQVDSYRYPRYP
ncbi:hypothetical protein HDK77DRAFT_434261 [Phyllosticta capitalensis]